MSHRDFFAFSTSLKPLELRALGGLSEVQHLAASKIIYQPGDPADLVYSINRGMVEIISEGDRRSSTYLSRGDVFGDAETLSVGVRTQTAKVHEDVSLQCFHRDKFSELGHRVPTFFQFLCEKLALRVTRAGAAPCPANERLELSGTLKNFDLVTIYQTIVNASQTGELSILNEEDERVAVFYFEEGKLRRAQFQHLTGEDAFEQLFTTDDLAGTFSFSAESRTLDCIQSANIERSSDDLLISALQSRDELNALKQIMPTANALLERVTLRFTWERDAPMELQPIAERIWRIAEFKKQSIAELFRQNAVCELKIYGAVQELMRSGHLMVADQPTNRQAICA